jgi:predicted amidohydrolase YtcJ
MILRGARLGANVVDVRIEGGLIAEIGVIPATTDESAELDGRWLVPGFWDHHVHFTQWALQSQRLDIASAISAAETARLIAAAIGTRTPTPSDGSPFIAVGFRDGLWPDAPSVATLDAASSAPIVVVSGDLHAVWLNSSALRIYGHPESTTGLLRENDAFRVLNLIDSLPDTELDVSADAAADAAAARGIVGIVDYEMSWNLETWTRRQAAGANSLRVEFGIYTEHLERAITEGLSTGNRIGELLTVGNFKILIDGSLNTRTAYCWDDYAGAPGEFGMLTVKPERLVELMTRASGAGIQPAVHAIGDRANTIALDAFQTVGCGGRIEHAQFVSVDDLPRFAELGVAASLQPDHAMDDRDIAEHYWAGRTDRAFPLRSLLDAGATLLLGSDAPVSTLDPWVTLAAAVGRSRDGREPWHPEQAIGVAEAIAASTRSRIAVGQSADLVVVDRDPYTATPDVLRTMPVSATLLGGTFTHDGGLG